MITKNNSEWNLQTLIQELQQINEQNIFTYFDKDNLMQIMASLKFYKKNFSFNSKSYMGIVSDYKKHKFYLFLNAFGENNWSSQKMSDRLNYLYNIDLSLNGTFIQNKIINQFSYKKLYSNDLSELLLNIINEYQLSLRNIQKIVFEEIAKNGVDANSRTAYSNTINSLINDNHILPTDYFSSVSEYKEAIVTIFIDDDELPF